MNSVIAAASVLAAVSAAAWTASASGHILAVVFSSIIIAAAVFLAAFSAGARIASKWLSAERPVFYPLAFSAGLATLVIMFSIAGFLHLLYGTTAALMISGLAAYGRPFLKKPALPDKQELLWLIPAGIFALVSLPACFVPPHQYDSLVYHLAIPGEYLISHAIIPLPDIFYSHFPQYTELMYSLGLSLKSDTSAQLMSWLCSAAACWWIYAYCRTRFGVRTAALAALLSFSHTSLMIISAATYAEGPLTLWITASVISMLEWKDEKDAGQAWFWAIMTGIFAGMAFGTKYYAGITIAVLGGAALIFTFSVGWFSTRKTRMLQLMAAGAVAAAVCLPWAVKNIIETGNPLFPFFGAVFFPAGGGQFMGEAKNYFSVLSEYTQTYSLLRDFVTFPYNIFAKPEIFGGGMDMLGTLGWSLAFASVPFMVYSAKRRPENKWLAYYLLAHWILWFFTGRVLRFLIVIVPLSAGLAAAGMAEFTENSGRKIKLAAALVLLAFLGARLYYYIGVQSIFQAGGVLTGRESRHDYLARRIPYYPCAAAFGGAHQENAKVLIAGDQRFYYTNTYGLATSIYKQNDFITAGNNAAGGAELTAELKKSGITHIIFVPQELKRLRHYGTLNFTAQGARNWQDMLESSRLETQDRGCSLYKLP